MQKEYYINKNKIISFIGKSSIVVFLMIFGIPFFGLVIGYGMIAFEQKIKNDKSFETTYYYKDYNSSAITFYTKELEESYQEYIFTDSENDLFKAQAKILISENCIKYHLNILNEPNAYEVKEKIRKNTRNKIVYNNSRRNDLESKINHANLNHYVYQITLFSDIVSDKSNIKLCNKQIPSVKIYRQVLPLYIKEYTERFEASKADAKDSTTAYYLKQETWLQDITKQSSQ